MSISKVGFQGGFSPDLHIDGLAEGAWDAIVTLSLVANFADFREFGRFSRRGLHHFRASGCERAALA